jgi:hypothetical protein
VQRADGGRASQTEGYKASLDSPRIAAGLSTLQRSCEAACNSGILQGKVERERSREREREQLRQDGEEKERERVVCWTMRALLHSPGP